MRFRKNCLAGLPVASLLLGVAGASPKASASPRAEGAGAGGRYDLAQEHYTAAQGLYAAGAKGSQSGAAAPAEALGDRLPGAGRRTGARAFMYAGAPTVGVTLWFVADEPTSRRPSR